MAEETKQEKGICPLCGAHEYVEPEVSDELKDAFLISMLGSEPFTRTYDILSGKVSITVKALTDEDNLKKSKLLVNIFKLADTTPDIKSYIPIIEQSVDTDLQVLDVSISTPNMSDPVFIQRTSGAGMDKVLQLNWDVKTVSEGKQLIDKIIHTFDSEMFDGNNIPKQLLRGVVGKHNIITMNLIKACLDENFLSGTGR